MAPSQPLFSTPKTGARSATWSARATAKPTKRPFEPCSPNNIHREGAPMLDLKGNKITYFGHSTFGLTSPSGQFALIDPWVATNPSCPENLKELARLDAIFLTHGHTDHFGDLLALAKQFKPSIVATFETYLYLESKNTGAKCLPGNKGGSQKVG